MFSYNALTPALRTLSPFSAEQILYALDTLWAGEKNASHFSVLFHVIPLSVLFCAFLFWSSQLLSPMLMSGRSPFKDHNLREQDRWEWHTCVVQCVNATLSVILCAPAFVAITSDPNLSNHIAVPQNHPGSRCGSLAVAYISGYMIFDLINMIVYSTESTLAYKAQPRMLYFGHHTFSFLFWPYAVVTNGSNGSTLFFFFIMLFILSEGTNLFMCLRRMFILAGAGSSPMFQVVSITWLVSYILLRLVPIPSIVALMFGATDWSTVSMVDKVLGWLTVPIPVMLNLYWTMLIVQTLMKMIKGKPRGRKERKNSEPKEVDELTGLIDKGGKQVVQKMG